MNRLILIAALLAVGCSEETPLSPPVEVSIVRIEGGPQPLDLSYSARIRGTREIEVRARVSGILERRYYQPGETVAAGTRLFRIDPAPYAAAVRSAQGQLGTHLARLSETEAQRARVAALFGRGFVSGRNRDLAEADHATARAAVAAARAELDKARLDLSYTEVRAPISGTTGLEARSEGSLIDATLEESSLLTTIIQTANLYVDFAIPEREAQSVRAAMAKGPVMVRLFPAGSNRPLATAPITFLDTRLNLDTGTVDARATLPNIGGRLSPGQFVRAELADLSAPPGTYIPSKAVNHGSEGSFVWKVDAQGKAQMQPVVLGEPLGNFVRIDKGLAKGDRVVTEGVLKLQPGAAVRDSSADKKPTAR